MQAIGAAWILALALAMGATPAAAQNSPEVEALLAEAAVIVARSDAGPEALRQAGYAEAARLLDQIVEEHPDTDAAIDILLGQAVGPVDTAAIRAVADGTALAAPAASPSPPDDVATSDPDAAAGEAALGLTRADRRDAQLRLALIGFDPGGIDGLFGPDTRAAIAEWQRGSGLQSSGYFDAEQLVDLRRRSASAYARWEARRLAETIPNERPDLNADNPSGRYLDEDGCLREEDGRVVPGYRLFCF